MNLSRIPSLALLLLGTTLAFAPSLHAGASNKNGDPLAGPAGNYYFNGGTFSAVIRGQNLSGTMLVSAPPGSGTASSNSSSTNGSGGMATILFQGNVFQANANANVDASSSQIGGNFYGGITLSGRGSNSILASTTNPLTPVLSSTNLFATNYTFATTYLTNIVPYITSTTNWDYSINTYTNTNPVVTTYTNYSYSLEATTVSIPVAILVTNYQTFILTNGASTFATVTNYVPQYDTNGQVIGFTNYTVNVGVPNSVVFVTNITAGAFLSFDTNGIPIYGPNVTNITTLVASSNVFTNTFVNVYTNYVPTTVVSTNTNYTVLAYTNTNPVVTVFTNTTPVVTYTTNLNAITYSVLGDILSNYTISSFTNTNSIIYSTNVMMTNYLNLQQVATTSYNDAVQFIGAYAGPLKNQYPNQTFLGNGGVTQKQISFGTDGIPTVQLQSYPISVQGILISSAMQTFPTYSNSVPYATTIYTQTNLTTTSFR